MASTYKIIRFHRDSSKGKRANNAGLPNGLTLKEAQDWCSKESTHKVQIIEKPNGERYESVVWFDGYTKE